MLGILNRHCMVYRESLTSKYDTICITYKYQAIFKTLGKILYDCNDHVSLRNLAYAFST